MGYILGLVVLSTIAVIGVSVESFHPVGTNYDNFTFERSQEMTPLNKVFSGFISVGYDRKLIWMDENLKPIHIHYGLYQYYVALELEDKRIAVGNEVGDIEIFDNINHELQFTLTGHEANIWKLIQLQNGDLASASQDTTIKIWNLQTGEVKHTLIGHKQDVHAIIQHSSGIIISGSTDNKVIIWNPINGEKLNEIDIRLGGIREIVEIYNGKVLFFLTRAQYGLYIWNMATLEPLLSKGGDQGMVTGEAVGPHTLIVAGTDGGVKEYNVHKEHYTKKYRIHKEYVTHLLIAQGGKYVVTTGYDRRVVMTNLKTKKLVNQMTLHNSMIMYVIGITS